MKLTTLSLSLLVAFSLQQLHAASTQVNGSNVLSAGNSNAIVDDLLNPIAGGTGRVEVGYFSGLTDTQVTSFAAAQDYATLVGAFQALANNTFGTASVLPANTDGFYDVGASGLAALDYTNDGGKSLYSFYTTNTSSLTAALGQLGLYRHADTISTSDPSPSIDSYSLANYGEGNDGNVVIGTATTITHGLIGSTAALQLVVVPEPGTALLGLLGFTVLLRRRR